MSVVMLIILHNIIRALIFLMKQRNYLTIKPRISIKFWRETNETRTVDIIRKKAEFVVFIKL